MSDDPFVTPSNKPKQPAQPVQPVQPSLPPPANPDFDDEPLTAPVQTTIHTPEHWPDEEATVAQPTGDFTVTEGELMQAVEWYFPLFWALCLIVTSYIGIYYAVDKLSGPNPLPPAWF